MKLLKIGLLAVCSAFAHAQPMMNAPANEEAAALSTSALFEQYQPSIFQIRVINQATGQKTSIGSGFVVGDGTMLASNYHVVSDAVNKEKHVLEYVDADDNSGTLTLLGVDVVHDLALLKADKALGKPFRLDGIPRQGEPLFALGNPHDLGFVIVDGINNGLLRKSSRARILFSGSLNSGMSGGPTLNSRGDVVGVNVAYLRQGNDISFVIPANYLQELLDKSAGGADMNAAITGQLFADNDAYFRDYLDKDWPHTQVGDFRVPMAMREDVRCWDSSPDPDVDDVIGVESVTCFNDRSTFINNDVSVGEMGYSFTHFYAREPILRARFYRLYASQYRIAAERRPRRDYGDYDCRAEFLEVGGKPFKTTFCRQPSKHFAKDGEAIEDMRLIAAQIGEDQEGLMVEVIINGVQSRLGQQVLAHILEQIQWQK
ncbi:MAG: serine protease [Cardiobacteriaceae bacterium]|nr:serine protease [Cardiobacteriaceae bacterium]